LGPLFERLAATRRRRAAAATETVEPRTACWLFKVRRWAGNVVLDPATQEDMCGGSIVEKATLEIVYDTV